MQFHIVLKVKNGQDTKRLYDQIVHAERKEDTGVKNDYAYAITVNQILFCWLPEC